MNCRHPISMTITTISELPNVPAVYAMYGGKGLAATLPMSVSPRLCGGELSNILFAATAAWRREPYPSVNLTPKPSCEA